MVMDGYILNEELLACKIEFYGDNMVVLHFLYLHKYRHIYTNHQQNFLSSLLQKARKYRIPVDL